MSKYSRLPHHSLLCRLTACASAAPHRQAGLSMSIIISHYEMKTTLEPLAAINRESRCANSLRHENILSLVVHNHRARPDEGQPRALPRARRAAGLALLRRALWRAVDLGQDPLPALDRRRRDVGAPADAHRGVGPHDPQQGARPARRRVAPTSLRRARLVFLRLAQRRWWRHLDAVERAAGPGRHHPADHRARAGWPPAGPAAHRGRGGLSWQSSSEDGGRTWAAPWPTA